MATGGQPNHEYLTVAGKLEQYEKLVERRLSDLAPIYHDQETAEGVYRAEEIRPGVVTHIPGHWSHRVVNTGTEVSQSGSEFCP